MMMKRFLIQIMCKFIVIVHRGGGFVREDTIFYSGGVQTHVHDLDSENWVSLTC